MNTEILVITDRSGSMDRIRADVIGGFNAFVRDQQAQPGLAKLTHAQFDNEYSVLLQGVPLDQVPALTEATYVPRGGTALYDAIGRTLNEQGARIKAEAWAELVVVAIITDGEENASREYQLDQVRSMTAHAEGHGWKFLYLAANQDAFAAAAHLGLSGAVASNFAASAAGTARAYDTMKSATTSLRSGASADSVKVTP